MSTDVKKALNQAIRETKRAAASEKQAAISAIQNDLPANTAILNVTTKLLRTLQDALATYEKTLAPPTGASRSERPKVRRGGKNHTPSKAFARPILEALHDMGGEAVGNDVLDEVAKRLPLKPADFTPTQTQGRVPRWRNAAMWVRYELTQQGFVQLDPTRKGHWFLTPQGERYLEQDAVEH